MKITRGVIFVLENYQIVVFFKKKIWGAFWRFLAWKGALPDSELLETLKFIQKRKMASHCEFCGTAFWPYLKKCKGCHTVYYCDRDCQTQDWKYHKISCSGDVIRKAIEASSMASHSSKTSRPLRVSKIPDKVNIHSSKFKRKI